MSYSLSYEEIQGKQEEMKILCKGIEVTEDIKKWSGITVVRKQVGHRIQIHSSSTSLVLQLDKQFVSLQTAGWSRCLKWWKELWELG